MRRKMLIVGIATEGNTDIRFLQDVVQRSFEDVAITDCTQDIDIYVEAIKADKGQSFQEYICNAINTGVSEYGIMALAMHTDSDNCTYRERYDNKFAPILDVIASKNLPCDIIVPIIPVRMTEAWMLADKSLFKEEIGSSNTDAELGLDRDIESVADPKDLIENAIRIAYKDYPKKRKHIYISELYEILGSKIPIEKLKTLPSFCSFLDCIRDTFKRLKYI